MDGPPRQNTLAGEDTPHVDSLMIRTAVLATALAIPSPDPGPATEASHCDVCCSCDDRPEQPRASAAESPRSASTSRTYGQSFTSGETRHTAAPFPRRRGSLTTRAPILRALREVSSVEPSSTTTTLRSRAGSSQLSGSARFCRLRCARGITTPTLRNALGLRYAHLSSSLRQVP